MQRHRLQWTFLIALVVTTLGCRQLNNWSERRSVSETREAKEYPYEVYPISEESKAKLCQALSLPAEDTFCFPGTQVLHSDVWQKVMEVFPVGETSYSEVEAKLGEFPHVRRAPTREDGSLLYLEYVYGLTEYEGACIYFWIDLEDMSTITRILASSPQASSGPIPTVCEPFL